MVLELHSLLIYTAPVTAIMKDLHSALATPREAVDDHQSVLSPAGDHEINYEFCSREGRSKITLGAQDL